MQLAPDPSEIFLMPEPRVTSVLKPDGRKRFAANPSDGANPFWMRRPLLDAQTPIGRAPNPFERAQASADGLVDKFGVI